MKKVLRFSAKFLFQYRVEGSGDSEIIRLCEERIIVFTAKSARAALVYAKKYGKKEEHSYKNSVGGMVYFEFVGVLDLLDLEGCGPEEVWYDITRRKLPKERAANILPAEEDLNAIRNLNR